MCDFVYFHALFYITILTDAPLHSTDTIVCECAGVCVCVCVEQFSIVIINGGWRMYSPASLTIILYVFFRCTLLTIFLNFLSLSLSDTHPQSVELYCECKKIVYPRHAEGAIKTEEE